MPETLICVLYRVIVQPELVRSSPDLADRADALNMHVGVTQPDSGHSTKCASWLRRSALLLSTTLWVTRPCR